MRIDCDIHPGVGNTAALFPWLNDHWREMSVVRGIEDLASINYPDRSPLTVRPDWRPDKGRPGPDAATIGTQCLDPFGSDIGILNCLFGVQTLFADDLAYAYVRALNDWLRAEFLDRDPRFRASIVVSLENVEMAVDEIERCAADPRFVQILVLAGTASPLGRRSYWPIYKAAVHHNLAIGIHAGSELRHPPTALGWPSYYLEDYVANAQSFQYQLTSLFTEGVFNQFPTLKVVMLESGWTWLPPLLWRMDENWKPSRRLVPWVKRAPSEYVFEHCRFTTQPMEQPEPQRRLLTVFEWAQAERTLLFASDYPHFDYDSPEQSLPPLPEELRRRVFRESALELFKLSQRQPLAAD